MGPSRGIEPSTMEMFHDFSEFFWGLIISDYPLVNVYITMGRSIIFHGTTHYFNGHVQVHFLYVYQAG